MSYCDDCIILDICGKEGCCDDAMTFCADKNKFIYVSILDKIRAEIDRQHKWLLQAGYTAYNVDIAFDAIKAVIAESEVTDADSD